ncbi:hypothetical protein D0Y65_010388 [Glycine soja]|uniref:RNase H type-1 domain-containing protein n=1 Tax=Glycine soja TaxID=3848 RepID=A0A445L3H5_GLYSO|nr:hypothetical protein D0Y65_010388 [Glycine soja]
MSFFSEDLAMHETPKDSATILLMSIALILAKLRITSNATKSVMNNSIFDFVFLRSLGIQGHPRKSQIIKQVSWNLFIQGWTKCNIDGAAKGNPSARCGGIFRNDRACALGCFTLNLRTQNSLFAELMGVILAIELVAKKNWSMLWLECD